MKKLFSLLLLLLSIFITLSIGADIVNAITEEDENYWRDLVKDKGKEVSGIKAASNLFLDSFNTKIIKISRFRETSEFKFDQLKLRLITEVFSPYSFRSTTKEACLVVKDFTSKYASAYKLLGTISGYVDTFEQMKKSTDSLLSKEMPADVKSSLESMRSDLVYICERIGKIQDKLKTELVVFDRDIKALNAGLPNFKHIVMKYVRECYLVPSMSMYNPNEWKIFGAVYKSLACSFYHNVIQWGPDIHNELGFLVSSFSSGILAFLLGWFLLYKFFKNEEARRNMFIKSLFWAVLGGIVFVYTRLIDFYPRIHFNYFLIVIFFTTSIMYLSWGFRCREYAPEKKSPFAPMLRLFIYGMILQFIDIYDPVLSVLWLLGMVINISYLKKQIRKNYFVFEKNLLIISSILYICCILMVLIGLTNLSILVFLTWFLICLCLQLGFNVNASARKIIEYFAGGSHSLTKIIAVGVITPIVWLVMIVFLYLWVIGQIFGSELLITDLEKPIHIHGVAFHLSYVGFGIYLFFIFRTISNMIKITIRKLVAISKIESGGAPSISLLSSYVLWCLYSVILLYLMGVNLTNIAVVTGGISVGLGFGLRDIVNNFLSSLIILLGRSIRHGDIIETDGIVGKVLKITRRSTVVQTNNNAIVAIPNSEIISSKMINWTGNNSAVMKEIKIGVSYDSDIEKVKYILLDIAKNAEHVLRDPFPAVIFDEFANSTLNFVLNIWVDDIRSASSITSLIREKINAEFKANGIQMAYPQMDVHIKEGKGKMLNAVN